MTSTLPATFFLYIRSRHSAKDPFSGFILCDAAATTVSGQHALTITPRVSTNYDMWTVQCPQATHFTYDYYYEIQTILTSNGSLLARNFSTTTIWNANGGHVPLTVTDPSGAAYPVLEMNKHTSVFGSHRLKRNVGLQWLPLPVPLPGSPIPNVIAHVPATPTPTNKKKPIVPKAPAQGDLQPYVAKQLLELARIKKETCPIVAEEFSAGNTAVMPCGHLFMQMAIEESFKKEPNKCPWCRQTGRPTYV
jgi:hypothetical protein